MVWCDVSFNSIEWIRVAEQVVELWRKGATFNSIEWIREAVGGIVGPVELAVPFNSIEWILLTLTITPADVEIDFQFH